MTEMGMHTKVELTHQESTATLTLPLVNQVSVGGGCWCPLPGEPSATRGKAQCKLKLTNNRNCVQHEQAATTHSHFHHGHMKEANLVY